MASFHARHRMSSLQTAISLLLVVGILYWAKVVVIPLILAVLLTFVLTPIVILMQRCGFKRVYGVLVTVFLTLFLFGMMGWVVGVQVHGLASQLPAHKNEIEKKLNSLREGGGAISDVVKMFREIASGESKEETKNESNDGVAIPRKEVVVTRLEAPNSFEQILGSASPVLEPLANTFFVLILVIFMLINREDLRNRFIGLLGHGRLTGTTRVIVESAERVSSYLLTQTLVNFAFGTLFGIGLFFFGVDYAFLWGFLTALLRFVPYIGTWISASFPLAISFATAPTWTQPILVLVYFGTLDLITANVIEPLLFGHRTGVSPIALLVAAAFWTWLWGPLGLLLSTPLTVCLVVLGQHVPRFQFFTLLLGDQPPLAPNLRYYQRLLARDQAEAKEVVVEQAKLGGVQSVCDDVLLPALMLARRDRKDESLNAEDEQFILNATREILTQLAAEPPVSDPPSVEELNGKTLPAPETPSGASAESKSVADGITNGVDKVPDPPVLIIGCAAHHEAEELALVMLTLLLKPDGCQVEAISTKSLPAEIEARVQQERPTAVFIAVLPPGGLVQARYLCKRLRKKFADLPIIVGYWGDIVEYDKLLVHLRTAGCDYVTTSLLQAQSRIKVLTHPTPPAPPRPTEADLQGVRS